MLLSLILGSQERDGKRVRERGMKEEKSKGREGERREGEGGESERVNLKEDRRERVGCGGVRVHLPSSFLLARIHLPFYLHFRTKAKKIT